MLKKNILYNFLYQFLIMILPFVTAPYLARVIGAEGIGIYSYSFSLASYFMYFSILGLSNYGNRQIASVKTNKRELSRTFTEIYCMQIATSIFSIIVYIFYIFLIADDKLVALCQLVLVCSALFDINWFFFGMEKFKLTVVRNTIVKLLTVLSVFVFVKNENDIPVYILIMAIGTLISQLSLWPFIFKEIDIIIPRLKNILKHFKPNIMLFIPVISVSIYKIMDKIMLGQMSSMENVGYFENAEKIVNVPVALIIAVGVVMLPRISSYIAAGNQKDAKKYFDLSMLLVLAFANAAVFGIASIAEEFVYIFYGEDFAQTATIMKFLAITIVFLAAGNVLRTQLLIPERKDSIYIISAILGACVNLIINIILIPKYHAIGASIGTILAELVVCFYQFFAVRSNIKIKKYIFWELIFFIAGIIMFVVIDRIPALNVIYLDLFVKILIGIVIYFGIAYLFIKKVTNEINPLKKVG